MNILVVEDETMVCWMIVEMLEERGHTVIGPCAAVNPALDLINTARIDCALLDINLGSKDTAYPIADRLDLTGIPYIMVSGYTPDTSRGIRYLQKPFSIEEFDDALTSLFAHCIV